MKIWKIIGYLLLILVALRIAVLFAVLAENRAPVGMWLVLLAGIATLAGLYGLVWLVSRWWRARRSHAGRGR